MLSNKQLSRRAEDQGQVLTLPRIKERTWKKNDITLNQAVERKPPPYVCSPELGFVSQHRVWRLLWLESSFGSSDAWASLCFQTAIWLTAVAWGHIVATFINIVVSKIWHALWAPTIDSGDNDTCADWTLDWEGKIYPEGQMQRVDWFNQCCCFILLDGFACCES